MSGPMNPYDAPEVEPRGMSGGTKVLLGFGIGCGVLLLLCCGFFVIAGVWFANYFGDAVSENPVEIRRITDDIVKMDIPDALEPKGSIDFRVPLSGERFMTLVIYSSAVGDNHMFLGEFGQMMEDSGDLEAQMRASVNDNDWDEKHEDVDIIESETHDVTIHDQEAHFRVAKAKGRESEKEFWEVNGQFHGDGGPAVLVLRLEAADFTKEQVIDVIDSMK